MKTNTVIISVLLAVLMSASLFAPVQAAPCGDGTTGTIDMDAQEIVDGMRIYFKLKGLTAGADYKLNWTGDDTGYAFTTGSSETEKVFPVTVDKPSSGTWHIYLRGETAGAIIDQKEYVVSEASSFINEDLFQSVAMVLITIALLVGIVLGLVQGFKKK